MQFIKRDLAELSVLSAVVLAFALAWGSPFINAGGARAQVHAQPQQQPLQRPDQSQSKAGTFTGTIVKNGDSFLLRDSSGATYGLDDIERARTFEGQTVKVTGQLDEQAKVIHVENIEAVEG